MKPPIFELFPESHCFCKATWRTYMQLQLLLRYPNPNQLYLLRRLQLIRHLQPRFWLRLLQHTHFTFPPPRLRWPRILWPRWLQLSFRKPLFHVLLLFFGFSKKLLKPTTMICFIITRALYRIVLYSLSCFSHCAQCHENIIVKESYHFVFRNLHIYYWSPYSVLVSTFNMKPHPLT